MAPLTNLGAVLPAHPEIADRVDRIVITGGQVEVPGNVEASPKAEWNIYIDPEAARREIATGIPITLEAPAATTVDEMSTSLATLSGFDLWDELAAITAVQPTIVTIEQRNVRVEDDGGIVIDPNRVTISVALHANPQMATEEFLRTLDNCLLPVIVPLTPSELDYMIAMSEADGRLSLNSSDIFTNLGASALSPRESTKVFAVGFSDAIGKYVTKLRAITPPTAVSDAHCEYIENLVQVVDLKEQIVAAIDKADGADAPELLQKASAMSSLPELFEQQRMLCRSLEDYSFLHNGPRPCSSAADQ